MTRPEDAWAPPREDRATTVRYGTIAATAGTGKADVVTVTGTTLVAVPIYGPIVVGGRVLLFLDGQKFVGVADGPAVYGARVTTVATGVFTVPLPAGLFSSAPSAVATVETTTQVTTTVINSATADLVTGKVHYFNAGNWGVAPGFLVHVVVTPRNLTALAKPSD